MGWIDVAIPGVIGFLLLAAPGVFAGKGGDAARIASQAAKMQAAGGLLLMAAGIYLFIKLASPR